MEQTPPIYDIDLDHSLLEPHFTPRQIDMLQLLANEITTYRTIGEVLNITEASVKNMFSNRSEILGPGKSKRGVYGNMELLTGKRIERSAIIPTLIKLGYATLVPRS